MSTRYLKKVFGSDIHLQKNEDDIPDVQVGNDKQKSFNVFSLLNDGNTSEDQESIDDNDDQKDKHTESENNETEDDVCRIKIKSRSNKKKRNKKKSQNKGADAKDSNKDGLDEIDRTLRQINMLLGESGPNSSTIKADESEKLFLSKTKEETLCVQHKHLNPYNELKRIFGSKTIQAENRPRNRGRTGHLKKTWLVSTRDNSVPIMKSGLSMSVDNTIGDKNNKYFVYEHSSSYKQVQQKFHQAVESLNPENIIHIVNEYPYHVDALLQSADLCKLSEEMATAANLTEQALFYLEYAFHPLFNMTTAKCRLDYRKQTNRALFITLFKHLIFVGGRACYRTSLELCKLLLSLEPEGDPLAVVLMIDFYAIRAKEYSWFVEFCNLWENSRNLSQLPNLAYSLALAYFHLGDKNKANELLQNALLMFPGVLIPLLDKCNVNPSEKIQNEEYFTVKAISSTPPSLEKLQNLFIARNFHLWKEADILPWLHSQLDDVFQRIASKDDYIKYCHVKRSKRYQGKLPRNVLRHIILSDLKDVTINGQEIQNEGSILSHDPLPPTDSINTYSNPRAINRGNQGSSNLLSLFFSSIFVDIERDVQRFYDQNRPDDN